MCESTCNYGDRERDGKFTLFIGLKYAGSASGTRDISSSSSSKTELYILGSVGETYI